MLSSQRLVIFAKRLLYWRRFSMLLDYRLSVIKVILIYGLITTQVEIVTMHENVFNKSTAATLLASILPSTGNLLDISVSNGIENTSTRKISSTKAAATSSIMLVNRISSAVFMTDDTTVDPTFVSETNISNINTDKCTNATINVNVNSFQIGTANRNMKAHLLQETMAGRVVKRKRCIRDLLAMTAKNTTALTSETTTINAKFTPTVVSLSIEAQNNSLVIPKFTKSAYTYANITDSLQLPQQQSKQCQQCKESRILSRSKRFLTFPEGSSFSVAVCITVGIIGNPLNDYMAYGLNWGVAYDLPNASWVINHLHGFSRHPVPATIMRRRTRRALYREIEALVDNMGYNGRDCILRALCESRQFFRKNKLSMVGEMLRVIFSLPKQRLFTRELHEYSEIKLYDQAYRRTRDIDCSEQYDCTFSLLELAFGKYSTPPPGYYQ